MFLSDVVGKNRIDNDVSQKNDKINSPQAYFRFEENDSGKILYGTVAAKIFPKNREKLIRNCGFLKITNCCVLGRTKTQPKLLFEWFERSCAKTNEEAL